MRMKGRWREGVLGAHPGPVSMTPSSELLWGGSGEKPDGLVWGISPALSQAPSDAFGLRPLTSPEVPHPAPTGSLLLEQAGPESSHWG